MLHIMLYINYYYQREPAAGGGRQAENPFVALLGRSTGRDLWLQHWGVGGFVVLPDDAELMTIVEAVEVSDML